jgi:hypothetical protein
LILCFQQRLKTKAKFHRVEAGLKKAARGNLAFQWGQRHALPRRAKGHLEAEKPL